MMDKPGIWIRNRLRTHVSVGSATGAVKRVSLHDKMTRCKRYLPEASNGQNQSICHELRLASVFQPS